MGRIKSRGIEGSNYWEDLVAQLSLIVLREMLILQNKGGDAYHAAKNSTQHSDLMGILFFELLNQFMQDFMQYYNFNRIYSFCGLNLGILM